MGLTWKDSLLLLFVISLVSCVCGQRGISVGVNIDPHNPAGQPSASTLNNIGATWVRIEYFDPNPQPTAFSFYDGVIASYSAANISVLLIVDYDSVSPGFPSYSAPPSDWTNYALDVFVPRVAAVAQHFQNRVGAYEIWNEEDGPPTSSWPVPASAYAQILQAAYKAVKTFSSAPVLFGGTVSGDPSYVTDVIQASGGNLNADAVGVHPYGQRPFPNWPSPTWGFGVMDNLLQSYAAASKGAPLWITEVGTTDASCEGQFPNATFVAANEMAKQVPVVIWYCWSDGMNPGFGLVDANGNPKAAYYSFQAFAKQPE